MYLQVPGLHLPFGNDTLLCALFHETPGIWMNGWDLKYIVSKFHIR